METAVIILLLGILLLIYNNYTLKKEMTNIKVERAEILGKYIDEQDHLMQLRVDNEQLLKGNRELQEDLFKTQEDLGLEREKSRSILSMKKSSETRLGNITENLVPILQGLPYDSQNLRHLGTPIDYLYFNFDDAEVVFIEVKSGNSKTSKRQKLIKNAIKAGKVYFEELRVNEQGVTVKRTKNNE